jgi:hypothetical protein
MIRLAFGPGIRTAAGYPSCHDEIPHAARTGNLSPVVANSGVSPASGFLFTVLPASALRIGILMRGSTTPAGLSGVGGPWWKRSSSEAIIPELAGSASTRHSSLFPFPEGSVCRCGLETLHSLVPTGGSFPSVPPYDNNAMRGATTARGTVA